MAKLFIIDKLRGLFGGYNEPSAGTDSDASAFDVDVEINKLQRKHVQYSYGSTLNGDTNVYITSFPHNVNITKAYLVPQAAQTALGTADYCHYALYNGTDLMATNINSGATAFTAGVPAYFTLTAGNTSVAANAIVRLFLNENSTDAAGPAFNVVLEYESEAE